MRAQTWILDRSGLDGLIGALGRDGEVLGPTARDGAIRYGRVSSAEDLPQGWRDDQSAGRYRLSHNPDSEGIFDYAVGPDSLKQFFHQPSVTLFRAERRDGEIVFTPADEGPAPQAFVGVRACELAAVAVQDAVLRDGEYPDRSYVRRRSGPFIVAVDCGAPAATCFCTSMGTGPAASDGFDIAMTETRTRDGIRYVCRAGSERGREVLDTLNAPAAGEEAVVAARRTVADAAESMPVRLNPDQARDVLAQNPEADVWTAIESRCLACTNCTLVCPTCFCTTVADSTDLATGTWTRTQVWDSCFSLDFSALHGRPVRASIGARYRQWLTHKLSTWYDQFGSSGCVGCGRCITWCPVGIDLVSELHRLSEADTA